MSNEARVLVVVDPTRDDQPAVARAAQLARSLACGVELFICHYDQYLSGERFFDGPDLVAARKAVMETMRERLDQLAEPLREAGLDAAVDAVWDTPLHEGIVRKAQRSGARMVMKDTHHHHALKRSLFSNTDWNLIRTCPTPLWLVKPRELAAAPRVVAAVDPMHARDEAGELDKRIAEQAREIADTLGAELHLFHAFDPAPMLAGLGGHVISPVHMPFERISEEMRKAHGEALMRVAGGVSVPEERTHLESGAARELLVEHAIELPADVVVMGAVARSAWKRILIGNTAEHVLDRIPCDVLIVKPAEFESPVRQEDAAKEPA